jgi:two-component system, cell cycle sensor histidine kinase and response regulator CckA
MPNALIVDDNEDNLYLLQCLLSANGFRVTTAFNGKEALDRASQALPDLVISDILMPVMDGFALCRQWKQDPRFRSIPFMFYTATYTDAQDEELALKLGADLFIVKPKDPDEFMQIIQGFIEKHKQGEISNGTNGIAEEATYLQKYNSALVHKLESKLIQLEDANNALRVKDFAIETSMAGMALADLSGTITYVNPSFTKVWGYEAAELTGKHLTMLAKNENTLASVIETLRAQGGWIGELDVTRKDGSPFIARVAAHTVTGPKNQPICLMISCMDITEYKHLQEERQHTQKMEALSLFAAGIAHDFNNLLTGLSNNLELSQEQLPSDSPAKASLTVAMSVFKRARDLSQSLLAFAKGGSKIREAVDLPDIIRESCALSLSGSGVRFEFYLDEHLALIEANANQLSQVITNIILNARQAMADSGNLTIYASNRRIESEHIGDLPQGEYVVIEFRNSGPGIPNEVLPRIFDPFFSTKPQGSGLGLATSYSIIKNHGGHIQATSPAEGGAVFEIWLPALKGKAPEVNARSEIESRPGTGRILIMDDEESVRSIAQTFLGRAGYDAVSAEDGAIAVEIYRKALQAQAPFDLVILDLTVRGGMGGKEALSELRKIEPRVLALASSGYYDDAAFSQLRQCGFSGLLPKPYSKQELLSIVKAAISQPNK